jgi:NAD(P)-dependent dehydrogenase (short-subunit alcohol dehydrogenase family)
MAAVLEQANTNIPPVKVYPDKFAGQVVVVTGAAQGIGETTAELFAEQGADVVLVDKNQDLLEKVRERLLQNARGKVRSCVGDLTNEKEVQGLVDVIVQTNGRIDVLVHLAGIYPLIPLKDATIADFHSLMNVNMLSTFLLTRAVLPHMQRAGWGRIINTASEAAVRPELGLSLVGHYGPRRASNRAQGN